MGDSTQASIVVAAEPAQVLDVIAEFGSYPEWATGVNSAITLSEDEGGWAEQVRFSLDAAGIADTYVLEYDWDVDEDGAGTVSWHLVEGIMLKAVDGSYVLEPVDEGTEVTYRLGVELKVPMLGIMRRRAEKWIIDAALQGLKKRVEG